METCCSKYSASLRSISGNDPLRSPTSLMRTTISGKTSGQRLKACEGVRPRDTLISTWCSASFMGTDSRLGRMTATAFEMSTPDSMSSARERNSTAISYRVAPEKRSRVRSMAPSSERCQGLGAGGLTMVPVRAL